ncbi:hypothetical protein ACP70R_032742 [Stipagrostis hirtigluma subsp. patula]
MTMALSRTAAAALLMIVVALTHTAGAAPEPAAAPAPSNQCATRKEEPECSGACKEACDLFEHDRAEINDALKKHCYRFCFEGCTKEGMERKKCQGVDWAMAPGTNADVDKESAFAEDEANATPTE